MLPDTLPSQAEAVRHFNRFYTRRIGVLHDYLQQRRFSLTEVRLLHEIANRPGVSSATLRRELGLDAGYVSRVLAGFVRAGLVARTRSAHDARVIELRLTDAGRDTYAPLDEAARAEVVAMLEPLAPADRQQLVSATASIERLLTGGSPSYLLRDPHPGDLGWVVHRHGVLYTQEYGWSAAFEGLVAGIVSQFARERDPARERCWIAERDGALVGSVFAMREDDRTARLRLLYVEPSARGLGIGQRLVEECVRFARQVRYERMVLWTNSVLTAARRLYERAGFELVEETPHRLFGPELVGQTWARDL